MAEELTARQREIRDLLNAGKTASEAAKQLGISANAVYMAVRRIEQKGHKVKVTKATGNGRRRKAGKRGKRKASKPSSNGTLAERIYERLKADIERVEREIQSNRERREEALKAVEALNKEHEDLVGLKERLAATTK